MMWRLFAWVVSREPIALWLIARSLRTPYVHIDGYMNRWWLFNPYPDKDTRPKWRHRLPSVRIHQILRADDARHPHDHPWDARTVILKGWYNERRLIGDAMAGYARFAGATASLRFGEYHHIESVSPASVFTLFITWKYQGTWGFLVDGAKVPHGEYDDPYSGEDFESLVDAVHE